MNKLYDALEICLQELEKGVSLENVLARYPDLAAELRPILKASLQARARGKASEPSPEALRRGRAKLLQRASEMREAKVPARKRVIPIFQRLALSLGVAAAFLLSGTGLVGVSASALPGEKLYPVKRTWEDVRLFFTFNQNTRAVVESQYEIERLHEVSELIAEGRHELIQFIGIFMHLNERTYISGVPVLLPANMQIPEEGAAVLVTGRTNAQGFVELESLELLPDGVFVPLGLPTELEPKHKTNPNNETGTDSNSNEASNSGSDTEANGVASEKFNASDSAADSEHREEFEVKGIVESISGVSLVINGKTVYFENATIIGNLTVGAKVEIEGYYDIDRRFVATEVKVKSGSRDNNDNSDSDSNDNGSGSDDNGDSDNTNDNTNDNDNDHDDDDDHDNDNDNNDNDNHNDHD